MTDETISIVRDFEPADATSLNAVALAAFGQFENDYSDWPAMAAAVSKMAELTSSAEIIVAEVDGRIVGGVAYVRSGRPKASFFDPSWPIIRMLVIDPSARGHGLGRLLTQACIDRARNDGARLIALHTSPVMAVALPMYLRMGFEFLRDAPSIYGVAYAVYVKKLDS